MFVNKSILQQSQWKESEEKEGIRNSWMKNKYNYKEEDDKKNY